MSYYECVASCYVASSDMSIEESLLRYVWFTVYVGKSIYKEEESLGFILSLDLINPLITKTDSCLSVYAFRAVYLHPLLPV